MIILETTRLYLRNFINEDKEIIAEMYSDIDTMRFIGTGITFTPEQSMKSTDKWNEYEIKHGFSNWAVVQKKDDKFIGKCGLNWLPGNSDIEISYILDKPYWGKGYATEIAGETLKYGFEKLGLKRITALVYPQNESSISVLNKIGMKYEKEIEFWNITFQFYSAEN